MRQVQLIRSNSFADGTPGVIIADGNFICLSLELPWYNNKPQISCIPAGDYICNYTMSPRMKKRTYELTKVKGRSGIRVHGGCWAGDRSKGYKSHVYGCLLLGSTVRMWQGQRTIMDAQATVGKFERHMNKESFLLKIRWGV